MNEASGGRSFSREGGVQLRGAAYFKLHWAYLDAIISTPTSPFAAGETAEAGGINRWRLPAKHWKPFWKRINAINLGGGEGLVGGAQTARRHIICCL